MNSPSDPFVAKEREPEQPPPARSVEPRPLPAPQGGRWWFAFDRWLAAPEPLERNEQFVMA